MSEIIKGPKNKKGFGDWSKMPSTDYSVRVKKGVLNEWQPDSTYKIKK